MLLISKKICMIGDFSVGKTSLIRRYMDNQFSDQYLTTVGVKISRKLISLQGTAVNQVLHKSGDSSPNLGINLNPNISPNNCDNNQEINLQMLIWDLEGSTRFQGIVPTYLQGAAGALIVADITRLNTIENLQSHVSLFASINPLKPIIIVLNKSDLCLAETRSNLIADIEQKMYQNTLSVLSASAKEDIGVTEAFTLLASYVVKS